MTDSMGERIATFLDDLDATQRAQATVDFDTPDHKVWTYLPGDRPGLKLADLTVEQREVALSLLDLACSVDGAMTARGIMDVELIRRRLGGDPGAQRRPVLVPCAR